MKKKIISLIIVSLLTSQLFGGCSVNYKPHQNQLEVWSFTNEVEGMILYFQEKFPDINVKFTLVPTDVYASKLKNAVQSGSAPDVFALEGAFVRSFVEEPGVMYDLDELRDRKSVV